MHETGITVSTAGHGGAGAWGYRETLARFLAPTEPGGEPLTETAFQRLGAAALAERCNGLIEAGRRSPRHDAAQAVESFIVFFQALVPTLAESAAGEVKATFFRLIPTLLPMAWDDVAGAGAAGEALRLLETILLEVSSVRLAPAESELLFKSLDQLATLVGAGEYTLARDVVAMPLLAILRKNRVKRSLFRLMEVEVDIQRYVQQRLGHESPQHADPRGPRRAVRLRPGAGVRGADHLRRARAPTSRCSCRTSPSSATSSCGSPERTRRHRATSGSTPSGAGASTFRRGSTASASSTRPRGREGSERPREAPAAPAVPG